MMNSRWRAVPAGRVLRTRSLSGLALVAMIVALASPAAAPPVGQTVDDIVHLNEVQVIGSHNSYRLEGSPAESDLRRSVAGDAVENSLQYSHAPLDTQFASQRVRQIELDVFRDDAGGKYADPLIREATGGGPYDPAMNEPGTKVLHVEDVDYRSNCLSLVACLETVRTWSDANPTHMPIAILIELKDTPAGFGTAVPDPWDAPALERLDDEILTAMPRDKIITPDDVRGTRATLEEAVLADGWPTLGASRGKVMFLLDNGGGYRTSYLTGNPTLEGRVIFTSANPGQPDSAFVKVNDAVGEGDRIRQLVSDGYLVRTRADGDTREARENDTSTREAALASGAQWVSTDYPVPEYARRFGTDYVVGIPGGTVARCNPVNAPPGCVDAEIDTIVARGQPPANPADLPADPPVAPAAVPVPAAADFTG